MFKNSTFSLLFILISLMSFSQQATNTIEVKISETVDVPVREYVYQVSNSDANSSSPFDFDFDMDEDEFDDEEIFTVPKSIASMLKELKGASFSCTVKSNANYDVDPGQGAEDADKYDREVIEVRVKTLKDLNRLSKFVLQMDDAYGELINVEFEDVSTTHATLFPKMMKQAKDKATIIANAAGKKVGDVVQVSEGNGGLNLYGDELGSYMETMMELSSKLWKKNVPTSKATKITLTYVFEFK